MTTTQEIGPVEEFADAERPSRSSSLNDFLLFLQEEAPYARAAIQNPDVAAGNTAIADSFYETVARVRDCVGEPDDAVEWEGRAFELMHAFISSNRSARSEAGEQRLFADAIFQECITAMYPDRAWEMIDLLGHSSKVGASNAIQSILLSVLSEKISREITLENFKTPTADAPVYIYLLRVKALAQLSAYYGTSPNYERERTMLDGLLAQYTKIGAPLVRLYADEEQEDVRLHRYAQECGDTDLTNPSVYDALPDDLKTAIDSRLRYEALFPDVPQVEPDPAHQSHDDEDHTIVQIAHNATALYGLSNTVERLYVDGTDYDAYDVTRYAPIYDRYILGKIADETTVPLADLSLGGQVAMLTFLMRRDDAQYQKFCETAASLAENDRATFAEAFLALEFGDDLGDVVLNLAATDHQQSVAIFKQIQHIRHNGEVIARFFRSKPNEPMQVNADVVDSTKNMDPASEAAPAIDELVSIAFIKRVTELLTLADTEGAGSVMSGLNLLADDVVATIADALQNDTFQIVESDESDGRVTAQALTRKVTITARPYGENARLGMTVRGLGEDHRQRVNVRLDYDNGLLSLDIGSTARNGVQVSEEARQLGELLARGELAIAHRRAQEAIKDGVEQQTIVLNGNHVREAFAPLGNVPPEQFAGYVTAFLDSLPMQVPTEP